jgi:hypothetical protein
MDGGSSQISIKTRASFYIKKKEITYSKKRYSTGVQQYQIIMQEV